MIDSDKVLLLRPMAARFGFATCTFARLPVGDYAARAYRPGAPTTASPRSRSARAGRLCSGSRGSQVEPRLTTTWAGAAASRPMLTLATL